MKNLMKLSVVLVAAALVFSSCNCFKKMAKNRDDINLTVTPEILTLNNGIVAADINVTFPVKYFNAKAVIKVTPVIVFDGGEVAGAVLNISRVRKSTRTTRSSTRRTEAISRST